MVRLSGAIISRPKQTCKLYITKIRLVGNLGQTVYHITSTVLAYSDKSHEKADNSNWSARIKIIVMVYVSSNSIL